VKALAAEQVNTPVADEVLDALKKNIEALLETKLVALPNGK